MPERLLRPDRDGPPASCPSWPKNFLTVSRHPLADPPWGLITMCVGAVPAAAGRDSRYGRLPAAPLDQALLRLVEHYAVKVQDRTAQELQDVPGPKALPRVLPSSRTWRPPSASGGYTITRRSGHAPAGKRSALVREVARPPPEAEISAGARLPRSSNSRLLLGTGPRPFSGRRSLLLRPSALLQPGRTCTKPCNSLMSRVEWNPSAAAWCTCTARGSSTRPSRSV